MELRIEMGFCCLKLGLMLWFLGVGIVLLGLVVWLLSSFFVIGV